jgi:peptidoglycan glycosyltransferase
MKTVGRRSIVLYILLACFIAGVGFLFFKVCVNGSQWVTQAYNGHIYAEDATAVTGTISDRNNLLLAETEDSSRQYSDNETIRRALLHTVGDSSGYIGTSIQAMLRSKLMGYNLITGLNRTPLTDIGFNNMQLSLDAEICAAAYEGLNGKNGAVIMYNYKTGEIICKVSAPSYDPGNVPEDLSTNDEYEGVFVDNTISSAYTPGSIFKVVTAICAMENLDDWDTRTYNCEERTQFEGGDVTCLDYHGEINMQTAMMYSCNCYFAQLAVDLGPKKLMATAQELGFNVSIDFTDFSTAKSAISVNSKTAEVNIGWAGVGQYTVTVNPTHFMCIMAAIANGGSYIEPTVTTNSIFGSGGSETKIMSASIASQMKQMLRNNVENYYGDDMFSGMEVCAKTGTAEVGDDKEPNAWMVGFSANDDTPYAFAVCVEEGGSGYSAAGSIASTIMTMARDRIS